LQVHYITEDKVVWPTAYITTPAAAAVARTSASTCKTATAPAAAAAAAAALAHLQSRPGINRKQVDGLGGVEEAITQVSVGQLIWAIHHLKDDSFLYQVLHDS
jgi:hypothetical protein